MNRELFFTRIDETVKHIILPMSPGRAMAEKGKERIRIDLNQFKLHIRIERNIELSLHFDSPSRRFYLAVMAFVVTEMQKLGRITSIPLEEHYELLALLNETVGGSAGSSEKEHLLPRIYKKWKGALPDLEDAPLFRVMGRKKEFDDGIVRTYQFSEEEKDRWANLFEYKGSGEHVRLRLSIDTLGLGLHDVTIVYGEDPELRNADAWERFTASCKQEVEDKPRPERAYQVLVKEPETPVSPLKKWRIPLPRQWKWPALAAVILFVAGGAAFAVWKHYRYPPQAEVASIEKMALPLPDKPSIAVLPFVNMNEDPEQEYFSDGISEEIITALSKTSKLFVIAKTSSFKYKGKEGDVRTVGRELGVGYVLEGSVRRSEDRLRITAQLVDAKTGNHVWAQRYDRDLKDIFVLQDEITMKIITALQVKLTEGEQSRLIFGKKIKNLDVFLRVLEARSLWAEGTKESQVRFGQVAQEIIDMAPDYECGYRLLAWHYWSLAAAGESSKDSLAQAFKLSQKALSMDEFESLTHCLLGSIYLYMRQYEKAIAAGKKSVELDPNGAMAHGLLGMTLSFADRADEGIAHLKKGIRLNPFPPYWYFLRLGQSYMQKGEYEEALKAYKKALQRSPDAYATHVHLAALYVLLDRQEEAGASAKKVLEADPNFSLERVVKPMPFKNKTYIRLISDAMRKAGLPE